MTDYGSLLLGWTGWLTQFLLAFVGFAAVLNLLIRRSVRWPLARKGWRRHQVPAWLLRLWRADRESIALQERRIWLSGCGLETDPRHYLAFRRMALFVLLSAALICMGAEGLGRASWPNSWQVVLLSVILAGFLYFDGAFLKALRQYRTDRIRGELIAVSRQLLYYTGSRLHLHGKLMRCLPLTRMIRGEWSYLLNEWYHDPDRALRNFKEKLGTEEAYGFSESLRSLRLHESEDVYDLIREMVREYKARMDLAKESRKEMASYMLFVLAGIPILYTFQVFLYPWVQEAAKLFDALNP